MPPRIAWAQKNLMRKQGKDSVKKHKKRERGVVEKKKHNAKKRVLKTEAWSWDIDGMGFGERRAIIFG